MTESQSTSDLDDLQVNNLSPLDQSKMEVNSIIAAIER